MGNGFFNVFNKVQNRMLYIYRISIFENRANLAHIKKVNQFEVFSLIAFNLSAENLSSIKTIQLYVN